MKNVSKKLFSLVLAAVLLLSVVPFQALAAEGDPVVRVFINNNQYTYETSLKEGQGYTAGSYLVDALAANKIDYQNSQFIVNSIARYGKNGYEEVDQDTVITRDMVPAGNVIDLVVDVTMGEQKPESSNPPAKPQETTYSVWIDVVEWESDKVVKTIKLENLKYGHKIDLYNEVKKATGMEFSGMARVVGGDDLNPAFEVKENMDIVAVLKENAKPEAKPEEKPEEQKVDLFVQVLDRDTKKQITSYSYRVKDGQQWDLNDTQKSLADKGYGIASYTVNGEEKTKDLYFTIDGNTDVIVYAVKTGDSKPGAGDSEDDKPIDPKEKTEVIIKVYEYKGNEKVDTIYYTGKRGSYVDLDQIVNKYVIRQYRYEGKSTNSRIKLQGEEMTIVAIMDEDQGDMCTVTFRVHFKNAIQKEVYKFKSGTEIDIGKILVEDDVLDSVKEIEKIYLRGVHVNKNNNIVTVKRSGTYDVYTDEKPYDSEDHSYPSYDEDEKLDKNAGKATLKFYLKKDMQKYTKPSAVKTITISNTAALDSKVTLQEVKKLAANYFKAENSEGIDFGDGLYIQEEYDNAKDVWDSTDGVDVFYNVNAMRNDGDVTFFVVLDNVKSVSSGSNADSSNPKTGDSIFVAVTVMAVSSLALGAAYVLNKKRMAR